MNLQRVGAMLLLGLWAAQPVAAAARTTPLIIDHTCTEIALIPEEALLAAKAALHIAYGHTSHGSQVTDGMTGLVAFADSGGKGMRHRPGLFAWRRGGAGGVLDLHDYAMSGDVGYYPQWVNNTRSYLQALGHEHVNVVMWSWCGQVDSKYADGRLFSEYLPRGPLGRQQQQGRQPDHPRLLPHLQQGPLRFCRYRKLRSGRDVLSFPAR